jgi:hypothetical protein
LHENGERARDGVFPRPVGHHAYSRLWRTALAPDEPYETLVPLSWSSIVAPEDVHCVARESEAPELFA